MHLEINDIIFVLLLHVLTVITLALCDLCSTPTFWKQACRVSGSIGTNEREVNAYE